MRETLTILAIESSCDESAVALARCSSTEDFVIVADQISSQIDVHRLYGGVVPEIASREHLRNIPLILAKVVDDAQIGFDEIDIISVTRGPGLKGCLLIGLGIAQGVAAATGKAIYGINHIEGHVLAPLIENPGLRFPFLCLVVSGGHTELLLVQQIGSYQVLARTMDDAAGEAFDKSAHLLGFEYPGGAELARLADCSANSTFVLPKVMREQQDFSFSGLKTAILQTVRRISGGPNDKQRGELAAAIQDAIVDSLLDKISKAVMKSGISQVAVTGGVAANSSLRQRVAALPGVEAFFPSVRHCTDNAVMIAYAAARRYYAGLLEPQELEVLSRWPVEVLGSSMVLP